MSKAVVFDVALKDEETLKTALKDAGFEVYDKMKVSYPSAVRGAKFFASGPGCAEVGFVPSPDGFRIVGDAGYDSYTSMSREQFNQVSGKICQHYGVAEAKAQAQKLGYKVRSVEEQPDGSMRIRAVSY
jgi:hypothetical protein